MDATDLPPAFLGRLDPSRDARFCPALRHPHDDGVIAAVGALYDALDLRGSVLDLMSSWVSHVRVAPSGSSCPG